MKKRDEIKEMMREKVLLLDGSYGSRLMELCTEDIIIPDLMNITHPELVERIHREYVEAGADIIITNTFGSTPYKLAQYDIHDHEDVIRKGVRIARKASCGDTLVFGDIGPTGKLPYPVEDGIFDLYHDNFLHVARTMLEEGVDGILLETFSDILELKAAVIAVRELSKDVLVVAQMTFDENGRTTTGTDPMNFAVTLNDLDVDVVGINCSLGPESMLPMIKEVSKYSNKFISVEPNAGLPVIREGRTEYRVGPDEFASHMESYWECGVNIIGGCCGTKREHIEKLRTLLSGRPPVEREIAPRFVVTCPGRIVDFDRFVVIGERINPAGRKRMKAVMASGDIGPILIEAREQVKAGASILDVNFGDERSVPIEFMERVVLEMTYGLNIPLSLDVQTVDILERLTRSYPGRPLVNSSTSRQEELVEKAGIIGRYGGILITLAMGRHVPRDFEERKASIENALKILDGIGIDRQRILFDPIVLSMGAGADPVHTLRTIDHLNRMGLFSVYGLSNLSFGMPKRSFLNSAFLVLSVEKGLRSAIMDPLDETLMGSLDSSLMIFGRKELPSSELPDVDATTRLILDGRGDELLAMIKDRAAQSGINKVVNEDLKPAMEDVGELYAKGRIYLPQLIRSAETVKPAFEYIDTLIDPHEEKETFMIATVKGDIHDIGKNIVAAIIRGSGYRVIDLGKDVPADVIVQETVRNGPIALGLSAMMTTTAPRIKEVVDLLKKNGCGVTVIAGGASLNEDAARSLGADHYSRDAVGAISILKRISSRLPDRN